MQILQGKQKYKFWKQNYKLYEYNFHLLLETVSISVSLLDGGQFIHLPVAMSVDPLFLQAILSN